MLRVLDLETTGVDPSKDHIIEIASVDLTRDGGICNPRQHYVALPEGVTIPPEVSAVNHILMEDLEGAISLSSALSIFEGADFIVAHNAEFEASFLPADRFPRFLCTYKAALRVWPEEKKHNLQALRYSRGHVRPFGKARSEIHPHRALSDVIVTAAIMHDLLRTGVRFSDLEAWTMEPALHRICPIGKYRGQTFAEIARTDRAYLEWIIGAPSMRPDVRYSAEHALAETRKGAAA